MTGHVCKPLWVGPGRAPICTQPDHFGQPAGVTAATTQASTR